MENTLTGLVDLPNKECCPKLFATFDSDPMRREVSNIYLSECLRDK